MHEGGRLRLGYFQQHSHGIHLVVRGLDLCQLNQGHPQGPDVGLVVVRSVFGGFAHDHFRGHPGGEGAQIGRVGKLALCGLSALELKMTHTYIKQANKTETARATFVTVVALT